MNEPDDVLRDSTPMPDSDPKNALSAGVRGFLRLYGLADGGLREGHRFTAVPEPPGCCRVHSLLLYGDSNKTINNKCNVLIVEFRGRAPINQSANERRHLGVSRGPASVHVRDAGGTQRTANLGYLGSADGEKSNLRGVDAVLNPPRAEPSRAEPSGGGGAACAIKARKKRLFEPKTVGMRPICRAAVLSRRCWRSLAYHRTV